ncbi:MAG: SDR family oxidoreductase [Armatimonadetes bacterium]|nr:SDR family oxidoreductase [Armatimonadota bacterium]
MTRPEPTCKYDLGGRVAVVTGAAGAIGAGICAKLVQSNCRVACTDLPGDRLDKLVEELKAMCESDDCPAQASGHEAYVIGIPMDVTDPDSVSGALQQVSSIWGGIDIAVHVAGVPLVAKLQDMDLDKFRRLEKINVEGTLLVIREMAQLFEKQGTGGDIVLISTKNVFSPGASFGAYSATKAAAHQLARIASLELAPIGVRVNMVAPDAVFGEGERKSGLWQEIGPERMRARGLDEKGLEDYYQSRNLLKARVTPEHVANAVLFFVSRQTPTTGATIPVDGGLPDATPR